MPFKSEKQRRYLHANHPEIAKRWERDYAHGGILDINESEEIISDDGNEIELTDYNAAFDDPNDFSTGVKSLFRAKDGGRIGFYRGSDRHEGTSSSSSSSGPGPGGQGARGQATQNPGTSSSGGGDGGSGNTSRTRIQDERQEDLRQQQMRDVIATGPGSDEEKYDTWEQMVQDKYPGQGLTTKTPHFNIQKSKVILNKAREDWNAVKDKFNEKYKKKVGKKIIGGLLGMGVTFGLSDMITLMIDGYKTNKAKQEFISDIKTQIENYMDLGLPTHSPHTDTLIQTLNQEILDLTQTKDTPDGDGDGDDGPIYAPLTGEVSEEYAQGMIDPRDWMAEIRARQAIYQNLKRGWENQQLNSGGLANLFRVKNQ